MTRKNLKKYTHFYSVSVYIYKSSIILIRAIVGDIVKIYSNQNHTFACALPAKSINNVRKQIRFSAQQKKNYCKNVHKEFTWRRVLLQKKTYFFYRKMVRFQSKNNYLITTNAHKTNQCYRGKETKKKNSKVKKKLLAWVIASARLIIQQVDFCIYTIYIFIEIIYKRTFTQRVWKYILESIYWPQGCTKELEILQKKNIYFQKKPFQKLHNDGHQNYIRILVLHYYCLKLYINFYGDV